ncbi:hypothetical protein [Nonomuraea diastatica]|uniref:Alpha-L-arabinofuranosidase n=1 Tax=Nonomuraea diastatica TaxID=1848329 RepID=A0A4R4WV11_9ACTN|nr:hypothetical protein [Nonomuraea diastatica]TDD21510.1 hypothetical protein E1294_14665 [Nonomuraea diastatica]
MYHPFRRSVPVIAVLIAVLLAASLAAMPSQALTPAAKSPLQVWVYPGNKVAIQPTVYGVNNEWRHITSAEFPAFNAKLRSFGYRLLRFPGGWESEHYDWATNTTPGWSKAPRQTGANATQAKKAGVKAAFVVKTAPYVGNPTTANLNMLKNEARRLVRAHGGTVKHWLIGNEWWLQQGGDRATKLRRYVTVARAIAREMKDANRSINVYVTGDWTAPWEFTWMRNGFAAGWRHVDGVDLHIYAGDDGSATDYRHIPRNLAAIKSRTGKSKILVSEWAATKANSVGTKRALRSVNTMVVIMHTMIRAGVTSMSYWPAPDIAQGIGLVHEVRSGVYRDLPHGQAFRWMANGMTGHSVATTGTPATVASHHTGNRTITVLIPSKELSKQPVTVHFANTNVTQVLSGHVMWMKDPNAIKQAANITGISVTGFDPAKNTVTVTANPATAGRGSSYELIKLVVRYR